MFVACLCAPARCTATATRAKPHRFDATIAANPSRRRSSDSSEDSNNSASSENVDHSDSSESRRVGDVIVAEAGGVVGAVGGEKRK
jgi:hypothetical protein